MERNQIVMQVICYIPLVIGFILYALDVAKTGIPLSSWKGKVGIAFIVISVCLIVIPVVLNPDLCPICEKVLEDKWNFCPYCGAEIGK